MTTRSDRLPGKQRCAFLFYALILIVPVLSHGQTTTAKSGRAVKPNAGSKAAPKEFTLSGNSLTLNLDRQGTSFTVVSPPEVSPDAWEYYRYPMTLPVAFDVKDGCNGWFSKEAIFILDQSWTIKVPWAADCPLPPKAKYLPIWALESMAGTSSLALKLDGKTFTISARQLSALKSFVESKVLPDATWRNTHEPYAVSASTSALVFASDLLDKHPTDSWGFFNFREVLRQSATLTSDEQGLTIGVYGSPDPTTNVHIDGVQVSWSLSWRSVTPVLPPYLTCVNNLKCISLHSNLTFYAPGSSPPPSEDDSTSDTLFNAAYLPRNPAFSDFNRALAYLWYQNMFVNQVN